MTFRQFCSLWFVSLDTTWYQSWIFTGLCINCLIHIPWFLLQWNQIWGSHCRNLLKECHTSAEMAACQIQSLITWLTINNWSTCHVLNVSLSGVWNFCPGVMPFHAPMSMIQHACITSWNLLKLCTCNSIDLKCSLNYFWKVWARFCFKQDMGILKTAFDTLNSRTIGFPVC